LELLGFCAGFTIGLPTREISSGQLEIGMHPTYTIGHSNLEPLEFLAALRKYNITLVADVRSLPRSSRYPQFSRENLEEGLREVGIRYLFLGDELGGRPADPMLYGPKGLVNYRARRACRDFQYGVERVVELAQQAPLALLCAEEDPITCHRFLLVTPELILRGIAPAHIRKGAVLESQAEAEDRLLSEHQADIAGASLFSADRAAALADALVIQAEKCAYRADPRALEYNQY
jgi:hypothetical protein